MGTSRPSVVIVDDDLSILEITSRALEAEGYAVESCTDGETALNLVRSHPPDVFGRWHIRRLRAKVEDDPASPSLIETVRGLGYKLTAGG